MTRNHTLTYMLAFIFEEGLHTNSRDDYNNLVPFFGVGVSCPIVRGDEYKCTVELTVLPLVLPTTVVPRLNRTTLEAT